MNEECFLEELFQEKGLIDYINFYFNLKHYKINIKDLKDNLEYNYLTYDPENQSNDYLKNINDYLINMTNYELVVNFIKILFEEKIVDDYDQIQNIESNNNEKKLKITMNDSKIYQIKFIQVDIFKYLEYKIKKINKEYLYSAYSIELDLLDKEFVWCTHTLDQSLLHPFNRNRITDNCNNVTPIIYRFKINQKNILLITDYNNQINIIFMNLIPKEYIDRIETYFSEKDGSKNNILVGENNYRILLILKYYNNHIIDHNNRIYGYYNYYDQNELALLQIKDIIVHDSLNKSEYINIKYILNKSQELINYFPIEYELYNTLASNYIRYDTLIVGKLEQHKYKRMRCNNDFNRIIEIIYQDFDNTSKNLIYNCDTPSEYIKNYLKYLKYKKKYIKLINLKSRKI